jgi:hypothetical protein
MPNANQKPSSHIAHMVALGDVAAFLDDQGKAVAAQTCRDAATEIQRLAALAGPQMETHRRATFADLPAEFQALQIKRGADRFDLLQVVGGGITLAHGLYETTLDRVSARIGISPECLVTLADVRSPHGTSTTTLRIAR